MFTGSSNEKLGFVNDPKAVILGEYSGHAGVKCSSDDLLTMTKNITTFFPKNYHYDLLRKNKHNANRAVVGNLFVSNSNGLNNPYLDSNASVSSFAAQGSTKTQTQYSKYVLNNGIYQTASNVLLNPASNTNNFADKKIFKANINNEEVEFSLLDYKNNKEIKSVESNLIKDNSEAIIQLLYLKEYLKIYDKNNTTSKKLVKKII